MKQIAIGLQLYADDNVEKYCAYGDGPRSVEKPPHEFARRVLSRRESPAEQYVQAYESFHCPRR